MASRLEQAMQARREEATADTRRRDPKATDITVSMGHGRCIVDYMDKDGEPQRFEHIVAEDEVALAQVEATSRRKEVIHGALR